MSLDTSEQSIVVEPWQHGSTLQSGAAEGLHDDMDEDEQPPTEYDEDGVLRTSLHSFSDLRVIQDMASRTPASGPGVPSSSHQECLSSQMCWMACMIWYKACLRERILARHAVLTPSADCKMHFTSLELTPHMPCIQAAIRAAGKGPYMAQRGNSRQKTEQRPSATRQARPR